MLNYKFNLGFLVIFCLSSCKLNSDRNVNFCKNSIKVSIYDSANKFYISNYKLYDVTNYAEGIILDLKKVEKKYIHDDSLGIVCLPKLNVQNSDALRTLIFVKSGYVFTLHYLNRTTSDTVFWVIRLKDHS